MCVGGKDMKGVEFLTPPQVWGKNTLMENPPHMLGDLLYSCG